METPTQISQVTTPCFLVDVDRVKSNARRMLDTCRRLKLDLRPHTKTHKTIEAADIATDGTRRKIACSTLPECEMYADNGFDDILLAFPISAEKIPRCVQLANRLKEFHVLLSGEEGVQCLVEGACGLSEGKQWSVFLELDCGYRRTGFPYDGEAVLHTARRLQAEPCVSIQGLYVHCGQSYQVQTPEQRKEGQERLVKQLLGTAQRLRGEGIEIPVVGTGSTPTCTLPDQVLASLDEFHPGNYIFYDIMQLLFGVCKEEDIAGCVATRVVCHRRDLNALVVDCGFHALGLDGKSERPDDYCLIRDHPHLRVTYTSQELGKIEAKTGERLVFEDYPVGTMLFIYPFHSCHTSSLHERYIVHSGQKVVGVWKPVRGW